MDSQIIEEKETETEIDLVELLFVLKDKILILVVSALICALLAFVGTKFLIQPLYSSTSQLYILTQSTSITSLTDLQIGTQLTQDYMELIKSRSVLEEVIQNLNLDMKYNELSDLLEVDNPENTRILKITVKSTDASAAKTIADEFAEVAGKKISQIMKTEAPTTFSKGYISQKPVNINYVKNILIGALIGLVLSAGACVVTFLMNDTICSSDDIEKYLNINMLAAIPKYEDERKQRHRKSKKKPGKIKTDDDGSKRAVS